MKGKYIYIKKSIGGEGASMGREDDRRKCFFSQLEKEQICGHFYARIP